MTVEEAREKAKKHMLVNGIEMRSCWNCNPAHEHLKKHALIVCYSCGRYFYKGIDITVYDEKESDA